MGRNICCLATASALPVAPTSLPTGLCLRKLRKRCRRSLPRYLQPWLHKTSRTLFERCSMHPPSAKFTCQWTRLFQSDCELIQRELKTDLIKAVAGRHPARPNEISDARYLACRTFLANFVGENEGGKIYTMNYDLLLYWALMHIEQEAEDVIYLRHDDGFRKDHEDYDASYVEWQGEGAAHGQNIHYLHGALHLFDAGYQLQKYTWINTGKALVDQAGEALKNDLFPVFVAEGDSKSKLAKIQHSAYLHHNFKSFAGVCQTGAKSGTSLFVYGHSFAPNDAHVLNLIGYGKVAHLFVSLHGDPDSANNKNIRAGVEKLAGLRPQRAPSLEYDFFDASSAKVWG